MQPSDGQEEIDEALIGHDPESDIIQTDDELAEDEIVATSEIPKNEEEEEEEEEVEDDNDDYEEDDDGIDNNLESEFDTSSQPKESNTSNLNGNSSVAVTGSGVFDSFNYSSGGDLNFSCHSCQTSIKSEDYGKIVCPNCNSVNFRYNLNENIHVTEFRTLSHSPDDNYIFKKILSKISNAFIGKNYYRAYNLCIEASEIAPGESVVWELFAQSEYFARTRGQIRPKQGYTPHDVIINIVKAHLKRAKFHCLDENYTGGEVVAGEIAEDISNNTRSKLGKFKRKRKKGTNEKMYSGKDLYECTKLLPQFKSAFKLSDNPYHLEAYVDELSKEYKWLIEKLDGSLAKMPNVPKKFNPIKEREYFINIIKHYKPEYDPPEILKERLLFDFSSMEDDKDTEIIDIPGISFTEEE